MEENTIKPGDYAIIQRQGYTKLHRLKEKGNITLGSFQVELNSVIGEKYFDLFQMKPKGGSKKFYTLEKTKEINGIEQVNIEKSGADNRDIKDDCTSQTLTKDELENLRSEASSSTEILEKLVSNSKTFNSKTEFSQEKYLKKKHKKYFDYIYLRKPTIRLLAQMFYRQDPMKILGIRIDDLSQILTYANVQSEGDYILYDSGTSGLITSAVMNAIGAETQGRLIHMHPGNECQKNAVLAMEFGKEQLDRCINVNLYSVLRSFYQNGQIDDGETPAKKIKLDDEQKKPNWQLENERACEILRSKVEAVIVVSREHPVSIVNELVQFLNASRSLVVFNVLKEPLQELYGALKTRGDFINIRLSDNFMRQYQVLPERTHPLVNMTTGGYLLCAHKLK